MTAAAKANLVSTTLRAKGRVVGGGGAANSWRRLWQVPLLIAGLAVFGFGVRTLVRSIKPTPFETQATDVRQLLALEQFDKAIAQINILANYYHKPQQQAVLQLLAGDTHYLAQKKQPAAVPANYMPVLDHYSRAVALGVTPTTTMNERWGEAALVVGDASLAVEKLEAAIAQDASLVKNHARELVSAYVAGGQLAKAQQILDRLLTDADLEAAVEDGPGLEAIDNRTWALCKRIELAIAAHAGPESLQQVIDKAREALKSIPERDPSGRVLTWIGRADLESGGADQAQSDLQEARQHFVAHHIDDGRAAVLLAKIAEAKEQWDQAAALYQEVVRSHAGTPIWAAARFGQAEVSVRQDPRGPGTADGLTPGTLSDYRFAIDTVKQLSAASRSTDGAEATATVESSPVAELISRDGVRTGLIADFQRASDANRLPQALTFLALQAQLGEPETSTNALRLAATEERRADELLAQANSGDASARAQAQADARAMYAQAAEDYLRHSKMATMEDALSGNSLWKAAQLFDKARLPMRSAGVYEQFTIQRPADARVPEGLLSIGRLYQSAGNLDKAIAAYQRNIQENPKTRAAYASTVNLAVCYMTLLETASLAAAPTGAQNAATTQGATTAPPLPHPALTGKSQITAQEAFDKAEATLLSLVQNNTDLGPTANEFRVSLFTLGELYYRNNRWADAILRLEEAVERYPDDPGVPRAMFMLAESFRRSAGEIREALAK